MKQKRVRVFFIGKLKEKEKINDFSESICERRSDKNEIREKESRQLQRKDEK